MGNRALVVFAEPPLSSPEPDPEWDVSSGIYIHDSGSPECVYQFLDELDRRKCRPEPQQEAARFCHIVCDWFDHGILERDDGQPCAGSLSVYVFPPPKSFSIEDLQNYADQAEDNGLYVVTRSTRFSKDRIVRRIYANGELTKRQVTLERKKAYEFINSPSATIAKTFLALRPHISKFC